MLVGLGKGEGVLWCGGVRVEWGYWWGGVRPGVGLG